MENTNIETQTDSAPIEQPVEAPVDTIPEPTVEIPVETIVEPIAVDFAQKEAELASLRNSRDIIAAQIEADFEQRDSINKQISEKEQEIANLTV